MRWSLIVFGVLLVLHFILYPLAPKPSTLAWFGNGTQWLALFFGCLSLARIAQGATDAEGWFYLALGVFVCMLAQSLLTYSELLMRRPSYGSVSDFIWIAGFSIIVRGLYVFVTRVSSQVTLSRWHAAGFLVLLLTLAFLTPALRDPSRSVSYKVLDVLYTLLEVWMLILAFLLAVKAERRTPWVFAAAALFVLVVADTVVVYFTELSHPVYRYLDAPFFVGYSAWWFLGALTRP